MKLEKKRYEDIIILRFVGEFDTFNLPLFSERMEDSVAYRRDLLARDMQRPDLMWLGFGGIMLVLWAFRRRDGLGAAVLPTDLPFWFDRMVTAAAAVAGLLVLAAAGRALARLLQPPEPAA